MVDLLTHRGGQDGWVSGEQYNLNLCALGPCLLQLAGRTGILGPKPLCSGEDAEEDLEDGLTYYHLEQYESEFSAQEYMRRTKRLIPFVL
jgi:hypothetical protein